MLAKPIANIIASFVKTNKKCVHVPCSMLARCSHDFPLQTHIFEKNMVQKNRVTFHICVSPLSLTWNKIQRFKSSWPSKLTWLKISSFFLFWRMLIFGRVQSRFPTCARCTSYFATDGGDSFIFIRVFGEDVGSWRLGWRINSEAILISWFSSRVLVSSPKTLTLSRWTDDEDWWFSLSQETPN